MQPHKPANSAIAVFLSRHLTDRYRKWQLYKEQGNILKYCLIQALLLLPDLLLNGVDAINKT